MIIINNTEYHLPDLDVFEQFALGSKLSPILGMMSLQDDRAKIKAHFPAAFAALARDMTREDKDEVLAVCLRDVKKKQGDVWVPVYVSGKIMFKEMDMRTVLMLVWETIEKYQFIDFFSDGLSESTGQPGGPRPIGQDSQTEKTG